MNYKLIAMDFDGTLLNDKKEITKTTMNILRKCKENGYIIVGVTARTFNSAKSVAPLNIFNYLILNNGSYIYDVKENSGFCVGKIDRNNVLSIINEVKDLSTKIDLVSPTIYYSYKYKNTNNELFINVNNIDDIKETIVRMNVFLMEQKRLDEIKNKLSDLFNNINCFIMQDSMDSKKWLVINPKGIDKKEVLEMLGKKLNIKLKEMIFFGDGLNDLPVMGSVGCSVAMGNALNEVKEKCNEVTLSNNEDGIAVLLEKKIIKNQK